MSLLQFAQRSRASDAFKAALASLVREGRASEPIVFDAFLPPVKIQRTLTKLLEQLPELEIERVEIRAASGCEFFRGEMTVLAAGEERRVRFHWDCKWKAAQQGWTDFFGFPDQIRAAREFGYDCFRVWEVEEVGEVQSA